MDERDGETDRHKSTFVLAKGQGTWRLNESNLDPVPAGSFERRDSLREHSVASRERKGASEEHQGGLFLYRYL